jgi:DICT domain-containing protein
MEVKFKPAEFSLYETVTNKFGARFNPQLQRKSTLAVLSHALEDAVLNNDLKPVIFTAFQSARHYSKEAERYNALGRAARIVTVYGCEMPNAPEAIEQDWFIIVNEPRFKAMMISREIDTEVESEPNRPFISVWSYDREVVDYACQILVDRVKTGNSQVSSYLEEVLKKPHQPLEQVKFAQEVGNQILFNLERINQRAIKQISHNQELLNNLEEQGKILEQTSQAMEVAHSQQSILQSELRKIYNELMRSQQIMTEALIEKAQIEQRKGLSIALLQQLEAEIQLINQPGNEENYSVERLSHLIQQLRHALSDASRLN